MPASRLPDHSGPLLMPVTFELIDAQGRPRLDPAAGILSGEFPRFLSCADLTGVRMTLPAAVPVASVRVLFHAGFASDTLNSWLRGLRLPPPGSLSLQGLAAQEFRWQVNWAQSALGADVLVIELRVPERPMQVLSLRFPRGPFGLVSLSVSKSPYQGEAWQPDLARDLVSYPDPQERLPGHGDPLAEQLLRLGGPTLHNVWALAQPYRGGALIGALGLDTGPVASVTWEGGIVLPDHRPERPPARTWFRLNLGQASWPTALQDHGQGQALLDGWLPVSVVRGQAGPFSLQQLAFIDRAGRLHVRWQCQNASSDAAVLSPTWSVARTHSQQADNDESLRADVHEPLSCVAGDGTVQLGSRAGTLVPPDGLLSLPPDGQRHIDLCLPLGQEQVPASFDRELGALREQCQELLRGGARLDLPDRHLGDLWRALLLHNHLFQRDGKMRYGLFPGVYDGAIFGVEEGWNIVAMAMYGHGQAAQDLLSNTFFDSEFLKKEGQHHQYRNGLCLTYALDVFRLTGDEKWLRSLWPTIVDSASWIVASLKSTQVEVGGRRPPYFGLMPRHTYGGDLKDPTYSLYGSSACWRGLRDAGFIARALSDPQADFLLAQAREARQNMVRAAQAIFRHDARPPFLPFRIDDPGPRPSAGDYHQLFSSLVLETALFGWQGPLSRSITDYLHQTGRLVLGIARFDEWFGRLGIDAEYSRGMQLARLCRREFDSFWLGVLGQIGLSCDPRTFVSPETAIVRFSRRDYQDRMYALARRPGRHDSDPCSAGTAVMLQYLRYLLAFEERDEDDLPTGTLWLGAAAPRDWFQPGTSFGATALPTMLGRVSFRCSADKGHVRYEVQAERPLRAELFYFDAAGKRQSRPAGIVAAGGGTHIEIPRG